MEIFKSIVKRIKELIQGQDKKKLIENTAIVIIVGIILIIAGSALFSGKPQGSQQEPQKTTGTEEVMKQNISSGGDTTETRLRTLLSQIQGVGRVDVMITYTAAGENVPAYDSSKKTSRTDEKDSEGGTRNMTEEESENTMVYEDSPTGGKTPVILKKLSPEVKGVLVVAEGADSVTVRERIVNAVRVVLDIPAHRVEVIQRKK